MTNRDSQGRFTFQGSRVESIGLVLLVLGLIGSMVWAGIGQVRLQSVEAYSATSTPSVVHAAINRTAQVQALIDQLVMQREQDPSFLAETAKEETQLQAQRHQAAVEDALMIIKTGYDVQLSNVIK